jgi:nanoRNase/pAp phosphatase (c-di-AMP/oligoRNAs hydrolase)
MSKVDELVETLRGASSLAVVGHDNPDPDCIASAMALEHVAGVADVEEVDILHGGTVTHQENRAFVNLLDVDLREFPGDGLGEYDRLAFVDHSVAGRNNGVPSGTRIDVVVDHHPVEEAVDARFVDRREELGATATILVDYLRDLEAEIDDSLATALAFALRRETLEFLRGTTAEELAAAAFLQPTVDARLLRRLASPPVSPSTVDVVGNAIMNRTVRGSCLVTGAGRTNERDALPQAADYLSTLEGISTVVVFGVVRDDVHLSARSTDPRVNVGEMLSDAFGDVGDAGGHANMAGGRLPLGLFSDAVGGDAALLDIVTRLVTRRVFRTMGLEDE